MRRDSEEPSVHSSSEIEDAPLEKVFDKIVSPFEQFIHDATAIALIVANTARGGWLSVVAYIE